jgi:penicillin-binding protein 2
MLNNRFILVRRFNILLVILSLFLLLIAIRLFWLQIYKNDFYLERSKSNSERIEPIKSLRGLIFDRNDNILADNILTYNLEIDIENKSSEELNSIIDELSKILTISEHERDLFFKMRSERKFLRKIPLKININNEKLTFFVSKKFLFPDVTLKEEFLRSYPHGIENAHLIGYINRISKKDLEKIQNDPEMLDAYYGMTHIGKQGIENSFEDSLRGKSGFKKIRVNAKNSFIAEIENKKALDGQDLILSINLDLQRKSHELLKNYKGSLIMADISNNEVLAYQSNPSFDPNLFVNGISFADWDKLNMDPNKPMLDRVTNAVYPPGSTIKPFLSIAGLENNVINEDYSINDPGFFQLPKTKKIFMDWKKEGHGNVSIINAIAESCDVYFYDLAYRLGIEKMDNSLKKFSFGQKTGINLPTEKSGILPSPEWKLKHHKKKWNAYETINTSIGQGDFLSSPAQLVHGLNILLNNKQMPPLSLIKDKFSDVPLSDKKITDEKYIEIVKRGMQEVTSSNGTFRSIANNNMNKIAGKTGTAQVFSLKSQAYDEDNIADHLKDHSLFIGYAPYDNPQVSIAVIIENGGHGSTVAAPIAKKMIDFYFETIK